MIMLRHVKEILPAEIFALFQRTLTSTYITCTQVPIILKIFNLPMKQTGPGRRVASECFAVCSVVVLMLFLSTCLTDFQEMLILLA